MVAGAAVISLRVAARRVVPHLRSRILRVVVELV